jgi:hypothetical protein
MSLTEEDKCNLIDLMETHIETIFKNDFKVADIIEAMNNDKILTPSMDELCGLCRADQFINVMDFILEEKKEDKSLDGKRKKLEGLFGSYLEVLRMYGLTLSEFKAKKPEIVKYINEKPLPEDFKPWDHPETQLLIRFCAKILNGRPTMFLFDRDLNLKDVI